MNLTKDLQKVENALLKARRAVSQFTPGSIASRQKAGGDPVTEADLLLDSVLKDNLLAPGEGWLSEETADDSARLSKDRVWIVDPLDGTREFIDGIPEWAVSVALVIEGRPVCGGVCNPAADQLFLGAQGIGLTLNGKPASVTGKPDLQGARIMVSRSELKKGLWDAVKNAPFEIIPSGSIAYKLACVSAGLADATVSLAPKNEWDVAGGWAMVEAAGGKIGIFGECERIFNRKNLLPEGIMASGEKLFAELAEFFQGF